MLLGRSAERARIGAVVAAARAGRATALLVLGEVGSGKSALLEATLAEVRDVQILRARGVPADHGIAHATLYDLCRLLGERIADLPAPHDANLRAALSLRSGADVDRLAVAMAFLHLLGVLAEEEPVLLVVDDTHAVDDDSLAVLTFVARRLLAERVAILLTSRPAHQATLGAELEVLRLPPLEPADAIEVLAGATAHPVAPEVASRLVGLAAGNPLALVELGGALSADQLSGRVPLPDPLPVGEALDRVFGTRVAALPDDTRRALLLAAACPATPGALARALAGAGLETRALEAAEAAGLVSLAGGEVTFAHPLTRSATYYLAAPAERRSAHAVLAAALLADEDQRAFHLSAAAVGPDEEVAAALEVSGRRSLGRGAPAAAAGTLQRAAALSLGDVARGRRLAAAASAALAAGLDQQTTDLLAEGDALLDPVARAGLARVAARHAVVHGAPERGAQVLVEAAAIVESGDPPLAATLLADAATLAVVQGRHGEALVLARRAAEVQEPPNHSSLVATTLGTMLVLSGDPGGGSSLVDRHVELVADGRVEDVALLLTHVARALRWLARPEEAAALTDQLVRRAREANTSGVLPLVLVARAELHFADEEFRAAWRAVDEAARLADLTAQPAIRVRALLQLAWLEGIQGRLDDAERHGNQVLHSTSGAAGAVAVRARHGLGLIALWRDDFEAAISHLEAIYPLVDEAGRYNPAWGVWQQDLVEAYVRGGRLEDARSLTDAFHRDAESNAFPLAVAIAERCRGLTTDDPAAVDDHHRRAMELGGTTVLSRARTQLCWGWRLRSLGLEEAAAPHEEEAAALGESIGAFAIVERARSSLAAAGASSAVARLPLARRLAAEELRVAAAVADGDDLTMIGAAILRAEPTVRKLLDAVYDEAGVRSPSALAEALDHAPDETDPSGSAGTVIRVLGCFEVAVDGNPVAIPEGQPATLVQIVCARGGQLHIDELVESLWPEAPPGRGRHRLRNVLNRLRRAAGDVVERRGELLALSRGATCDALQFEQTSATALEARGGDRDRAAELARRAVAGYGGDLLPGSVYEPWSSAPRERLARRHLALLDLLAEQAAEDGAVDEAVRWWTNAADAEPLDEARLIRAAELLVVHERNGQARVLARRARRVVEELGTSAPATLVALEARLARGA